MSQRTFLEQSFNRYANKKRFWTADSEQRFVQHGFKDNPAAYAAAVAEADGNTPAKVFKYILSKLPKSYSQAKEHPPGLTFEEFIYLYETANGNGSELARWLTEDVKGMEARERAIEEATRVDFK